MDYQNVVGWGDTEYKVEAWNNNSDMNMQKQLSECSAAAKEANNLFTVVHAV